MNKFCLSILSFFWLTCSCNAQNKISMEDSSFVFVTYFGATPNDNNDDTDAFSAALEYCNKNQRTLFIPSGTYNISKTLIKPESFSCPSILGENKATVIDYQKLNNAPAIKIIGGSGRPANTIIENITFIGNSTSTGIEIAGQNKVEIKNCLFYKNKVGVLFHNELPKSFTEYCVIDHSFFDITCAVAYEYKRSAGTDSFNGTGAKNIMVNSNNDYAIKIGPNCVVYNAPLDGQFWTWQKDQYLIQHLGSTKSNLYGNLTIESGSKSLSLVNTSESELIYVGNISATTAVKLGNLVEAYNVNITGNEDGNAIRVGRKPRRYTVKLHKGKNVITNTKVNFLGESVLANVVVRTDFYEDRTLLSLNHNGYGQTGTTTKLSQDFQTNKRSVASFPKYYLNEQGEFIIEMPDNIGNDVMAFISFIYLSSALSVN